MAANIPRGEQALGFVRRFDAILQYDSIFILLGSSCDVKQKRTRGGGESVGDVGRTRK